MIKIQYITRVSFFQHLQKIPDFIFVSCTAHKPGKSGPFRNRQYFKIFMFAAIEFLPILWYTDSEQKAGNIPDTAMKPERANKHVRAPKTLSEVLKAEKAVEIHGGIYHKIQIDLTYNFNHMEGSFAKSRGKEHGGLIKPEHKRSYGFNVLMYKHKFSENSPFFHEFVLY